MTDKPIVLVTDLEYAKAREYFAAVEPFDVRPAPSDEAGLAEMVLETGVRAVIVGVTPYTGALYEALHAVQKKEKQTRGSLIARFGVGTDGIDRHKIEQMNISLMNTPGVLEQSVAEHTFWLAGALARNIAWGDRSIRNGDFPSKSGFELSGKCIAIVGLGTIGQQVARIAQRGFGMRVLAVARRSPDSIEGCEDLNLEACSPEIGDVLPQADIVSLHLASTPETYHFINEKSLTLFPSHAILINTARGPLVDEIALYQAIHEKRLAGAALDVFEKEPYSPFSEEHDLRSLPNVVLTPHLASSTQEANLRMAKASMSNVRAFYH